MFIVITCGGYGGGGCDFHGIFLTERHVGSRLLVETATTTSMGVAHMLLLAPHKGMVARVDVGSRLLLACRYVNDDDGYACYLLLARCDVDDYNDGGSMLDHVHSL